MRVRTLGSLVGFSLQICAGATSVIWPNEKLVAWAIFGFGSAILVISLVCWLISWGGQFTANYEFRAPWAKRDAAGTQTAARQPVTETAAAPFHQDIDRFPSPTISQLHPTLEASLYVCDIRFTFADLKKNRHSELTMCVFNGSGRVVQFVTLSGKIKFNAPNNSDPDRMGELPTPALRPDTARTVDQLQEWLLILSQQVPADEADKILAMLRTKTPIHFDLSGLNIRVAASDKPSETERLPVWSGVSYKQDYGFARIISASININLGQSSSFSD
jgi:hypothetical protein